MAFDQIAYKRQWRAANKERLREADRLWSAANRDKKNAAALLYRQRHPEKVKEINHRRWITKKAELTEQRKARKAANPEKYKMLDRACHLAEKYGLSAVEYAARLSIQGGCCAICRVPASGERFGVLCVDHDHATGGVRGLLCVKCNAGIGMFNDDPVRMQAAAEYARQHSALRAVG